MGNDKKSNTTGKVVAAIIILVVVLVAGYLIGRSRDNSGSKSVQNGDAPLSQTANRSAAVAELEAMLKEKPGDVDLLITLGDAYFEVKQFGKAADRYKSAIKADPAQSELYNDIGLALHYVGNSAEGIKYIEEGIKQNPYQQRIWLTKGFILAYGMGDLDAAKEAWEKTRALDPESGIGKAAADYLAQASKR